MTAGDTALGALQPGAEARATARPIRVSISGGTDFDAMKAFNAAMTQLGDVVPIGCVIAGTQRGAETMARLWAQRREVPLIEVPTNWRLGRRALECRDRDMMLETAPDVLLAFPGTRFSTKRAAQLAGVPVIRADAIDQWRGL